MENIPNAAAINRNVRFTVAVIISGNGFVACQTELLKPDRRISALQNNPESRTINGKIGASIAVIIGSYGAIIQASELNGIKGIRR